MINDNLIDFTIEPTEPGQPAKVIAARCGISPSTVHVHRTHIASKLGVKGLSRLVHLALAAGLGFDRDKWS